MCERKRKRNTISVTFCETMIFSTRSNSGSGGIIMIIFALLMITSTIDGFVVPSSFQRTDLMPTRTVVVSRQTVLLAENSSGSDGGQKKKRRRRKRAPRSDAADATTDNPSLPKVENSASSSSETDNVDMEFGFDDEIKLVSSREKALDLPNIRDAMAQKRQRKKDEATEAERKERRKISRSDTEAMARLLEMDPLADDDKRNFEDEEYNTVSALLAEGAKPFLGITSGQLQVGHFILSLGIVLMAFVEYPGFPLTNLPTPLRECLQSGLLTIYVINTVLSVLSVFKAMERNQPPILWAVKTFSVGGLAFDQLTQLPTKQELERMGNKDKKLGRKRLARR